jgi:hypothetical protein
MLITDAKAMLKSYREGDMVRITWKKNKDSKGVVPHSHIYLQEGVISQITENLLIVKGKKFSTGISVGDLLVSCKVEIINRKVA